MIIRARAIVIALVCGVCACTAAPHDPPVSRAADPDPIADPAAATDDTPAYITRMFIPPTAEMARAAQANDLEAMRDAVAFDTTCHATSSCPSQFGSCSGWSASTLCSSVCNIGVCLCKPIISCTDPPETKGRDTYNAFRVCFDSNQNGCTEWLNTSVTTCGC
jgi:hypothetical protein